jgi:hypothetical protein
LKEPGGIKRQVRVSKDRVDFCNSVYSPLHTNIRTNRNPLWNTSTWHFTVWVLAVWRIANVFQFSTGGIRLTLSSPQKLGGRGFRRCTTLSRTAQQHATIQVKKMHHLRLIAKLLLQPEDQMDFESTTDQTDWARQIFKLLNSRAVRCGGRTVWRQGTSTPLRVKGTGAWFDRFVRSIRLLIEWTCSCLLACSCHTIFRDHSTLCMVEPNERW